METTLPRQLRHPLFSIFLVYYFSIYVQLSPLRGFEVYRDILRLREFHPFGILNFTIVALRKKSLKAEGINLDSTATAATTSTQPEYSNSLTRNTHSRTPAHP